MQPSTNNNNNNNNNNNIKCTAAWKFSPFFSAIVRSWNCTPSPLATCYRIMSSYDFVMVN